MTGDDTEYYRDRAAAEWALARASNREDVSAIHEDLARQYEALVERPELRPILRISAPTHPQPSAASADVGR